MKKKIIKRKKIWEQGGSSAIGFVFSICALTIIFMSLLFISEVNMNKDKMDEALSQIGRKVIVCEDIKEARKIASKEAKRILSEDSSIASNVSTEIKYISGDEWKKGALIEIKLTGKLKRAGTSLPSKRTISTIVMVE